MTNDEIFDLDKTRDRSRLREPADSETIAGGLDGLLGRRRPPRVSDSVGHDLPRLVAMVDAAAANRAPMPTSSAPSSVRPSRRRIDWLSAAVGAVAVVTVAVASTFTAVQIANASPTGDAVALLQSDEDALTSAELALTAARVRVEEQIQSGLATAQAFQAALTAFTPAEEEDPFLDQALLDGANLSATQYTTALQAIVIPEDLEEWKAPKVDEESLTSVAAAIDEVQGRTVLIDDMNAELRTTRQSVEAAATGFAAGIDAFRAGLTASAATVLEDAPDADQTLRDAVTLASTTAGAADLTTSAGAAALLAYRDAVRALRDGQVRAEDDAAAEREREREREQNNANNNNQGTDDGNENPEPTDPGTGDPVPPVTDPPPVVDPPVDPPVDPNAP